MARASVLPAFAGHEEGVLAMETRLLLFDLDGTLVRTARALRPGGRLIVLDTPVAREPRPGSGSGDRHLGRKELHQALLRVSLRPRWIRVRRGPRWWVHQAKVRAKGDALFSLPMIVADREIGDR